MTGSPTQHPQGQLAAAISNFVVRLVSEYTGRGPTQARTHMDGDLISVVLRDTLTRGERSLVRDGRSGLVLDMRKAYQDTMAVELTKGIEDLSGRKVHAFLSDNHIDPDVAVETFVLEPLTTPPESDLSWLMALLVVSQCAAVRSEGHRRPRAGRRDRVSDSLQQEPLVHAHRHMAHHSSARVRSCCSGPTLDLRNAIPPDELEAAERMVQATSFQLPAGPGVPGAGPGGQRQDHRHRRAGDARHPRSSSPAPSTHSSMVQETCCCPGNAPVTRFPSRSAGPRGRVERRSSCSGSSSGRRRNVGPSWPVVLQRRFATQAEAASLRTAIVSLPRVEQRILALFWQLAERWGKVGADGVRLELKLTHELIGRLAGAKRPTRLTRPVGARAAGGPPRQRRRLDPQPGFGRRARRHPRATLGRLTAAVTAYGNLTTSCADDLSVRAGTPRRGSGR